jgi:hypothetical protein
MVPISLPYTTLGLVPRCATQVDQIGLFTTAAAGISLSNLAFTRAGNQAMVGRVRAQQVLDAALYDFLFCCADRHAQVCLDRVENAWSLP